LTLYAVWKACWRLPQANPRGLAFCPGEFPTGLRTIWRIADLSATATAFFLPVAHRDRHPRSLGHASQQSHTAISAIMAKAKLFGLIGNKRADTNNNLNPYSQISSDELIYQITSTANEIRSSALSRVPAQDVNIIHIAGSAVNTAGVQLGVQPA
jgi:hypothetical protein